MIAPIFWFPAMRLFGRAAMPPAAEMLGGIPVTHPRMFYTPGIMIRHHWRMYRASLRRHLDQVVRDFRPDHVIAGFAYPDGAAVGALCGEAGIPWSVRVNGSDFRIRIRQAGFREMVLEVLREARWVFCPGSALKRDIAAAGIDAAKIVAFENGVDGESFKFRARDEALSLLSSIAPTSEFNVRSSTHASPKRFAGQAFDVLPSSSLLFVGNLLPVKGPDIMLEAFTEIVGRGTCDVERQQAVAAGEAGEVGEDKPNLSRPTSHVPRSTALTSADAPALGRSHAPRLFILGDGPMRKSLARRAGELGIANSVEFLGARPHDEVAGWMNAADCLCVTSRSEGMPNVVVEALASGLPVVASDVGECRNLLGDEPAARVVPVDSEGRADPVEFAMAACEVMAMNVDRVLLAEKYRGRFSWDAAARRILEAVGDGAKAG